MTPYFLVEYLEYFCCSISFVDVRNITKAEYRILRVSNKELFDGRGRSEMNSEIKELNRIICKECDEKDYEECRNCKVYQLINKIAAG